MTPATTLARDAALLEFSLRRGTVPVLLPVRVGGKSLSGCTVRQGTLLSPEHAPIGTLRFGKGGMALVDQTGNVIERLNRFGVGKAGCYLEHPLHKARWASVIAKAEGQAAPQEAATVPEQLPVGVPPPAARNGRTIAVVAAIAVVCVAAVLYFFVSTGTSAPAEPAAPSARPGVAATATAEAAPAAPAAAAPAAPTAETAAMAAADGTPAGTGANPTRETLSASPSRAEPGGKTGGATTAAALAAVPTAITAEAHGSESPAAAGQAKATASDSASVRAKVAMNGLKPSDPAEENPAKASRVSTASATPPATGETYRVRRSDCLYRIGQSLGLSSESDLSGWIEACMRLNALSDANTLEMGQRLKLPPITPVPKWKGDLYSSERYPGFGHH